MPFVGETIKLEHPRRNKDDRKKENQWILLETLIYQAKVDTFEVPKDFPTDLASVPRPLVWLVPRYGRYTRSAILHDYLLADDDVDKHDADGIFRRSLRELDVPFLQRWMMWGAVGLNSTLKDRRESLTGKGLLHALGLVAVVAPSLAFVFIPGVIVLVWLIIMAVLETIAYPFAWLANRLKPLEERRELNKPKLLWKL